MVSSCGCACGAGCGPFACGCGDADAAPSDGSRSRTCGCSANELAEHLDAHGNLRIVGAPGVVVDPNADPDTAEIRHFSLRVLALLLLLWATHLLVMAGCALLPLFAGRAMLQRLKSTLTQSDIYALLIGVNTFAALGFAGWQGVVFLRRNRVKDFVKASLSWIYIVNSCAFVPTLIRVCSSQGTKCAVVAVFALGLLPFMAGLLFDLVFVLPLRASASADHVLLSTPVGSLSFLHH